MIFIYTLSDPATLEVRYVGKSADPTKRLAEHIRRAKAGCETYCRRWIASVLGAGQQPKMDVVDEAPSNEEAGEIERRWIAACKVGGCRLTNLTVGGDGRAAGSRLRPETRARMSAARKGKRPAQSTLDAARLANSARKRTPDQYAALVKANRERVRSPEELARLAAQLRGKQKKPGWKHTPEAKAKIGAASKARNSAAKALGARWALPQG